MNDQQEDSVNRPWPGFFLVIEGIDGTGKSTLAAGVARALGEQGHNILQTFEPTAGPHGQMIRELALGKTGPVTPREEMLLFVADRMDHVELEILPALRNGYWVVLDRYYFSTMAYQGAKGLDADQIQRLHQGFAPNPDLLVIMELPVEDALHRIIAKRGSTPDNFEQADYLELVKAEFDKVRHPNLLRLDARENPETLVRLVLERMNVVD